MNHCCTEYTLSYTILDFPAYSSLTFAIQSPRKHWLSATAEDGERNSSELSAGSHIYTRGACVKNSHTDGEYHAMEFYVQQCTGTIHESNWCVARSGLLFGFDPSIARQRLLTRTKRNATLCRPPTILILPCICCLISSMGKPLFGVTLFDYAALVHTTPRVIKCLISFARMAHIPPRKPWTEKICRDYVLQERGCV